jgi:predicted TPR repeat methyltransferase
MCWCRLRKAREAAAAFRKMLRINPSDNQGARFSLAALEAGKTWEQMEDAER